MNNDKAGIMEDELQRKRAQHPVEPLAYGLCVLANLFW